VNPHITPNWTSGVLNDVQGNSAQGSITVNGAEVGGVITSGGGRGGSYKYAKGFMGDATESILTNWYNVDDPWDSDGDIAGMYVNMDDMEIIIYENGTLIMDANAGDFSSFANDGGGSRVSSFWQTRLGVGAAANSGGIYNFGCPTFAISSSNADANGYGNFEYDPTIGGVNYYALCTKNILEFG